MNLWSAVYDGVTTTCSHYVMRGSTGKEGVSVIDGKSREKGVHMKIKGL
jgi:hypothetical protein